MIISERNWILNIDSSPRVVPQNENIAICPLASFARFLIFLYDENRTVLICIHKSGLAVQNIELYINGFFKFEERYQPSVISFVFF